MKPSYGSFRRLRDRFRARRDGRRDGLLGIPTRDEVAYPPALQQITQRGDEALAALSRGWAGDDARLRELDATTRQAIAAAEADVDGAAYSVAELEERHSVRIEERDAFAAQATTETAGARISKPVYAVALVAILIAEFPLNAIAFRLFGEAEVLTWVMTASLAVTLVLCAHGLGTFLRVEHPAMAERRWIVVLVALPVLAIVAIAVIRARYLSMEAELTGLDVLGPLVGSLTFLVINLLVYTGATMLSYMAHAPRIPGEREAHEAAASTGEDLTAAQQRLSEATRRIRASEQRLSHADVAAEEALRVARARASEVVAYYRQLMAVYCAANLRARGNPELPTVLRELPSLDVPPALREEASGDGITAGSGNGHVSEATVLALGARSEQRSER